MSNIPYPEIDVAVTQGIKTELYIYAAIYISATTSRNKFFEKLLKQIGIK